MACSSTAGAAGIANRNDGTRAATTPGYEASVEFVQRRLTRAGYKVSLDPFDFHRGTQNGPATLSAGGRPTPRPATGGERLLDRAVLRLR